MWTVEVWLVAVTAIVDPAEIRRHWNVKETPRLDRIMLSSPSLRIGTTDRWLPGNEELRGPVGRVIDVLFLRGTTPEYVLPALDDNLADELFEAQSQDPPFEVAPRDELARFLDDHRGAGLTYRHLLLGV